MLSKLLCNVARPLSGMAFGLLLLPIAAVAEPSDDAISVSVDQAKLFKLPNRVATIVVTGKGYGATNFIAMDRGGEVLVDRTIQVEGPTDRLVTVYRGVDRETYSCMPLCQRRVTLGDDDKYFQSVLSQSGNLNSQAAGNAAQQTAKASVHSDGPSAALTNVTA